MRNIIVSEFLILDGVTEAPEERSFPYQNDETVKFKTDELLASHVLLLQIEPAAWPGHLDRRKRYP